MELFTKAATNRYYNIAAYDYFLSTHQIDISDLWNKIDLPNQESIILDIGCGSGRDLRHFGDLGYKAIGIDISFSLIRLAHEYSKRPVAVGDLCYLPFKKSFSVVWAIASLLHIKRRGIKKALSEINRVLMRDSIFIASVKKGNGNSIDNKGRFFTYYQPGEWANLLQKTGFDLVSLEETIEIRNTEAVEWIVTVAKKCTS